MSVSETVSVVIISNGNAIDARYDVLSVSVLRSVNRIPVAELRIQDGDPSESDFPASQDAAFAPGANVEIRAGYGSKTESLFKGIIVLQRIQVRRARPSVLVVQCRDAALKLAVARRSAVYLNVTDGDVFETVAQRHQLRCDVQKVPPKHAQVVQADENDWDFLRMRAERSGVVLIADDGRIVVATPTTSAAAVCKIAYGDNLLELEAETDAREQFDSATAYGWSPSAQSSSSAKAKAPTFTCLGNAAPKDLAAVAGAGQAELRHGGNWAQNELEAWASAHVLFERMSLVRGRVRSRGVAAVRPGSMIELAGLGTRFSGKAYVTGVRHEITNGDWQTDCQFGLSEQQVSAAPHVEAARRSAIPGLQIGVVTRSDGDPDNEERVEIRLPLLAPDQTGIWARLASLDAGEGVDKNGNTVARGFVCRPEVGDEVIVGFLHSDPDHPVILGMLHSSAKPAPIAASSGNDLKGLTTRSGLILRFDDASLSIRVETPAGNRLTISDQQKALACEDQSGNRIQLDANGVLIESASALTLKAKGDITVDGANVNLTASAQLKGAAKGALEISSSATASLRGSLVRIN